MSAKKAEINVSINCRKCKTGVMKIAAKFTGVDEVKLDVEKGILTVTGAADPVCITRKLRKAGYFANIESFGPPKKPEEKKPPVKSPEKSLEKCKPLPPCCNQCQLIGISYVTYDSGCSIL